MKNERKCKYCNKILVKKIYDSGRKENLEHFEKRIYCDKECMKNDYKNRRYTWTKEEEKILIEEYKKRTNIKIIAEKINKTQGSIKAKAHELNITNKDKYYTSKQIKFMIENKDKLTYQEMAKKLNKDVSNICRKFKELGIKKDKIKSNFWSEENQKNIELWKKHQRETRIKNGTLNPMKNQKNPYSRAKGGKRKDLDNIYFRSSWEANIARYYNYIGVKWEYEPKTFIFNNITRGSVSYTPDFYLPEQDKWIEIKGWMDGKSKTKLKRFEKQYPEEYKKLELIQEKEYNEIKKKISPFIENWE